ncbi:FecR domain-containing protein [Chitinophaga pollutisoli]|uniref:FecR domain-containing protein n=1 Tax=Chitinophaga pollutisoli TaxID=3133966 RepID=A0ABZ2YNM5_9BACT
MSTSTDHEKLLQRYLDGDCTPEEAAELMERLRQSGAHREVLQKMQEEFPVMMASRPEISPEISQRIEARLLESIRATKVRRLPVRRWVAAAAVLLLLGAGGAFFLTRPSSKSPSVAEAKPISAADIAPGSDKAVLTLADGSVVTLDSAGNQVIRQGETLVRQQNGKLLYSVAGHPVAAGFNTLTVPRGGQFQIVLPDGSRVWLNSTSKLRFPTAFHDNKRVVELEGQGYFEVSKDALKPFIVQTQAANVEVLGTGFDVMAYPDERTMNTTLLEGAVKVKDVRLKPGQQARLEHATGTITVAPADVQQVIAWKTGFFEFDNADIDDILRQAARWYDVEVVYRGKTKLLIGGRISRQLPLSELLKMLEDNGAKFSMEGRRLIVH